MRFMLIRRADDLTEAGGAATPELLDAMMAYHDEMARAGVLLEGMGLAPSSEGARIDFPGGKPAVVDGPFAETKELIAGFSLIEVRSREEALEWVRRWPLVGTEAGVKLELRRVLEPEEVIANVREQDAAAG